MPTNVDITLLCNLILFAFSCFNFWRARKTDTENDTEQVIKSNIKLDQLCSTVNETRNDVKGLIQSITALDTKQIKSDAQIDALWKRVDEHTKLIHELENSVKSNK